MSLFQQPLRPPNQMVDDAVARYIAAIRADLEPDPRFKRRLRGRYLELRYEDLVTDPEPGLRRVCELVELDFDAAMLEHERVAAERLAQMSGDLPAEGGRRARSGAERMHAHALASQPAAAARVELWRDAMSPGERAEFERVAGRLLAQLGYDLPS